MDNVIKIVQVSESEVKNIQLSKNLRKEVELAPAISYENYYKAEDSDFDVNIYKAKAKNNELLQAKS